MKYDNHINLIWVVVWGLVLAGAILGMFWKPALWIIGGVSVFMLVVFAAEFIRILRMK